jgi:predicted DNA-binding protein
VRPEKKFDFLKMESNEPEFRLPKEIAEELKRQAKARGMTLSELLSEIIREELEREDREE